MHKDRIKGTGSFEDDLYASILKDSKVLTKARNMRNRDENIFLAF